MSHRPPNRSFRAATYSALFALIGTLCASGPAMANADFQRHYELGKDFLQRQEYKLAIGEFDLATTMQASPAELSAALVDRGTAYSELKNYPSALKDFDHAITLDGKSHLAYNNRGVVFLRQGIADKAIENFDRALALDPEDQYALVNRAGAYLMSPRPSALAPKTEAWIHNHLLSNFAAQATVLTVLAYLANGDKKHAVDLAQSSTKIFDRLHWPYHMLSYVAGKIKAEKVVEAAEDSTYELTQAQCYLGLDAYFKGKEELGTAADKLGFVLKHGTTNSVEYWVAKYYMNKIAPDKKVATPAKPGEAENKYKTGSPRETGKTSKKTGAATGH